MAKTNQGLAVFAEAALDAKLGYVWGTFGQVCSTALLDQKASQYPANNLAGGYMRQVGNKWIGRRVVDCAGLIKYYLFADKVGDNPVYNAKYDTILFNSATKKGPISSLPEIPGICLYMPGHTGVYMGNGRVIEAAGTLYGVVESRLPNCHTGSAWTHWYEAPGIVYSSAPVTAAPEIKGLSLDTRSKDMDTGEKYTVLARCKNKPVISNIVGRDVISVSEPRLDPRGRGWLIDVVGVPAVPEVRHGHIEVTADGVTVSCNFNVT